MALQTSKLLFRQILLRARSKKHLKNTCFRNLNQRNETPLGLVHSDKSSLNHHVVALCHLQQKDYFLHTANSSDAFYLCCLESSTDPKLSYNSVIQIMRVLIFFAKVAV